MAYALQPTGAGYAPQQTGYARQETGASPEASFALCEARLCQRAANMVAALEALGALRGGGWEERAPSQKALARAQPPHAACCLLPGRLHAEARKAKLEECEDEFQGAVYEVGGCRSIPCPPPARSRHTPFCPRAPRAIHASHSINPCPQQHTRS